MENQAIEVIEIQEISRRFTEEDYKPYHKTKLFVMAARTSALFFKTFSSVNMSLNSAVRLSLSIFHDFHEEAVPREHCMEYCSCLGYADNHWIDMIEGKWKDIEGRIRRVPKKKKVGKACDYFALNLISVCTQMARTYNFDALRSIPPSKSKGQRKRASVVNKIHQRRRSPRRKRNRSSFKPYVEEESVKIHRKRKPNNHFRKDEVERLSLLRPDARPKTSSRILSLFNTSATNNLGLEFEKTLHWENLDVWSKFNSHLSWLTAAEHEDEPSIRGIEFENRFINDLLVRCFKWRPFSNELGSDNNTPFGGFGGDDGIDACLKTPEKNSYLLKPNHVVFVNCKYQPSEPMGSWVITSFVDAVNSYLDEIEITSKNYDTDRICLMFVGYSFIKDFEAILQECIPDQWKYCIVKVTPDILHMLSLTHAIQDNLGRTDGLAKLPHNLKTSNVQYRDMMYHRKRFNYRASLYDDDDDVEDLKLQPMQHQNYQVQYQKATGGILSGFSISKPLMRFMEEHHLQAIERLYERLCASRVNQWIRIDTVNGEMEHVEHQPNFQPKYMLPLETLQNPDINPFTVEMCNSFQNVILNKAFPEFQSRRRNLNDIHLRFVCEQGVSTQVHSDMYSINNDENTQLRFTEVHMTNWILLDDRTAMQNRLSFYRSGHIPHYQINGSATQSFTRSEWQEAAGISGFSHKYA